jgi:hypothetical protein
MDFGEAHFCVVWQKRYRCLTGIDSLIIQKSKSYVRTQEQSSIDWTFR